MNFFGRLFASAPARRSVISPPGAPVPPGVLLRSQYLTQPEQEEMKNEILTATKDAKTTSHPEFKRRIYNFYTSSGIRQRIPKTFECMERVHREGIIPDLPDSVQINIYENGGGCPMHTDAKSIGDSIAMFSLMSPAVMGLGKIVQSQERLPPAAIPSVRMLLVPGSLLVMRDEVRYNWEHGIVPEETTEFNGERLTNQERISVVFWKTIQYEHPKSYTMRNEYSRPN
eukprot:TRINITY_DN12008_c0_g1_i1.p1 TRINITY_DN12008_c0_g1~~TRINITY_DN12008_c0_g1_i1.p1  ORF type:complete len:228 (+),score=42.04 TRINITY_DN12008_c0_g1_i1:72-755(+)